ncbi:NADH dehydrogenase [ubiquinone] 1 alpha subcomplex assembly factor 2 isoform X2 [Cardiocondyla obscurior]|uniref:NADH dehydrogenase [ubiquinone] 1 alpha subcomplex assembly factor 2 isoform X2 n=1 Tax=Cardiocondyla obscurior TaxID=286306 RepID=UPI003965797F
MLSPWQKFGSNLNGGDNMARERGVFKLIWKSFISSLKPRFGRGKLIGEDYYGTKYYEEEIRSSARKRPPRYFVPVNKDDFEQELPAEWEAWLRYRRKDPPTREEIDTNYQLAMMKKTNAAKLLENRLKNEGTRELPTVSTQSDNPGKFPIYEDYKNFGSNYEPKDSYK